jgi:hypothetical protein
MANTDFTAWPVYGQQFGIQDWIIALSTLNPLTGGLTGLAATISKDGATPVSTTNAPTEVGTTGEVRLVLTAAEMSYSSLAVVISASNTGAVYAKFTIQPLRLAAFSGRADAQSPLRFEQFTTDNTNFLYNEMDIQGAAVTLKNPDGSNKVTGVDSQAGQAAIKGKMS